MNYKVLYRKYRPQNFEELVGQDYIKEILQNSIKSQKMAHAYIFTGPRGTGKTSTAKIFAKAVNCLKNKNGNPCGECSVCKTIGESPDILEIDAASNNGVDEVRELIDNIKLANSELKYKVYIIDEVHMMTTSAFNALLLTLEEPPSNVIFILATTDIQNVPITIVSRCQVLNFKPITDEIIKERLVKVCELEKISAEEDALLEIANLSNGGLRDALGYLDQLSSMTDSITLEDVVNNYSGVSRKIVEELLVAVDKNDFETIEGVISKFKNEGTNIEKIVSLLVESLKEKAILQKKSLNRKKNLTFEVCMDMCNKLLALLNKNVANIDLYTLILLIMLEPCEFGKEQSGDPEIIPEKQEIKYETSNKSSTAEFKEQNIINNSTLEKNISIKINNCLCEASLDEKKKYTSKWSEFVEKLKTVDKKLYGLVFDSTVAAASNDTVIILNNLESESNVLNIEMRYIEQMYEKENGDNVNFVSIYPKKWEQIKNEYKENRAKGVVYNKKPLIVDEEKKISNDETAIEDIFSSDKIEIV